MQIKAKSAKVAMTLDGAEFPWDVVPPPGSPGGKNAVIDLEVDHGGGVIRLAVKGGSAQKALTLHQQSPQGGFVILQGRLVDDHLEEAGIVYQPKKAVEA